MAFIPPVALVTDEQKVSYGFGLQFGRQLRRNDFEGLDLEAVMAGVRHWYEQQRTELGDDELNTSYRAVQKKQEALVAELAQKRQQLAAQFLEANAAREGVTTTDSGLQYEVLEEGVGDKPGPRATILAHYHGTFVDGTVFDSSVERGEPAEFGVHEVIPGWTEALQMMSVGEKWRIACPPALAYGDSGAGDAIPPNTALLFDIHLIAIK